MAVPPPPPPPQLSLPALPELVPDDIAATFPAHGIFATLRPYSALAIANFSSVVDAVIADPTTYARVRRRIRLDAPHRLAIADSSAVAGADLSASSDATNPNTPEPPRVAWHGMFVFSYQDKPLHPQLGWVLGYGPRHPLLESPKPDIPLSIGPHYKPLRLHATTARFNIDRATTSGTIAAGHSDGTLKRGGEKASFGTSLLLKPNEYLTFGDLEYHFHYVPVDRALLCSAAEDYLRDTLGANDTINHLVVDTPSTTDRWVGEWRLVHSAGMGTDGEVVAGMRSNGDLVAIKDYTCRDKRDVRSTLAKIDNYRRLQSRMTCTYVQGLVDVLNEHKICQAFVPPQHVYSCLQPLVLYDLKKCFDKWDQDPSSKPAEPSLHQILAQTLLGISALHDASFVHDDIKPANIGIQHMLPLHVVILDLDNVKDISSTPDHLPPTACLRPLQGRGGTIGYLAPEREGPGDELYGTVVDVWNAGCVAMEIFLRKPLQDLGRFDINPYREFATFNPPPDLGVVRAEIARQQGMVSKLDSSPGSIGNLIREMLVVDPNNRITVDRALKHPLMAAAVSATLEQEESAAAHAGEKRNREAD